MVSSGVPQVIGDRHAPEISMLAMDILRIDFMLQQFWLFVLMGAKWGEINRQFG